MKKKKREELRNYSILFYKKGLQTIFVESNSGKLVVRWD